MGYKTKQKKKIIVITNLNSFDTGRPFTIVQYCQLPKSLSHTQPDDDVNNVDDDDIDHDNNFDDEDDFDDDDDDIGASNDDNDDDC